MSALLESLRQHVEWILLDSPPVLAVTDAIVLARNVDAVILVVEAGRARAAAVSRVKEHLERLGVKVIGVVLNKAPLRHGSDYYGYYADAHPESDPSRTRGTR
jgi:Mrp family chromosome partitioning ATPase